MLRTSAARVLRPSTSLLSAATRRAQPQCAPLAIQQQSRQQHAVSNPTLANIEKRWEAMPPQEQAELWMALRDRMTVDWHELTTQEKKASYWIAFGPHGPRKLPDPGEKWIVMRWIVGCLAASAVLFGTGRYFARPPPKTMSKEWQELTNEYMKSQKSEPITGISSEGYAGPGMIQSGSRPFKGKDDEE